MFPRLLQVRLGMFVSAVCANVVTFRLSKKKKIRNLNVEYLYIHAYSEVYTIYLRTYTYRNTVHIYIVVFRFRLLSHRLSFVSNVLCMPRAHIRYVYMERFG